MFRRICSRQPGSRISFLIVLAGVPLLTTGVTVHAQPYPNPYRAVDGWALLPDGRTMGAVGGVTVDRDGAHVWAVVRCDATDPARFGNECLDSDLDPILKFDLDGNVVQSFGSGLFIWPHGIDVDPEGNVWVTDAVAAARTPPGTRGHQVIKFSPDGRVLLTLGTPGVPGNDANSFNAPSDVVVADNGDIFVADGHADDTNNRIVKYSSDGTFIKAWGETGYGPGEFRTLHALAIDARGRLFVADRSNNRIQIFDQDGNLLECCWEQYSRLSGIWIDENDMLYGADSESGSVSPEREDWLRGIRIGNVRDGAAGRILALIPDPHVPPAGERARGTLAAEGVAVDKNGVIYGAEVGPRVLKRYVRR